MPTPEVLVPQQAHLPRCNTLFAVVRLVHNTPADQKSTNGDRCDPRNGTNDDASYNTGGEGARRTGRCCVTKTSVTTDQREGRGTKRGRHTPAEILAGLGNVDIEELVRIDIEDVVVCMGAVEAVVIVEDLCDELLAEAK